jgi:nicotinamide mononucleotide transporter
LLLKIESRTFDHMEFFGEPISYVELAGTLFGIIGVWLTIKKNIFNFPFGIINVALYAFLFFQSKLYADASLQIIYIILLVYGWIQWTTKKAETTFEVQKTSLGEWLWLNLFFVVSTLVIGTIFRNLTDASLPYLDSMLASVSLIAQWMIAKKKIENWMLWIIADVIYVGLYIYKHLYFTSILYFIFIFLAILGWREWKKTFASNG